MDVFWMAMVAGSLIVGHSSPVEFAPGPDGRQRAKVVVGDIVSQTDCERKVLPKLMGDMEKMGFKVDVALCSRPTGRLAAR